MGSNESAAIMAATASHAVGLQTHGIVSIRHGGTMLFKVVACTGAFNAGALVEWVRQTTGSLMVEDVYNAALSVGFGNKEDLVVQEAGGTKAFDESLEPDARFDDFRLFLDQSQQSCRRSADPALPLFPLTVTRQAHAHQWSHLRLCQMGLFPNFPRREGDMDNSGAFAFRMGDGFGHCLDQIVAEGAHLFSFRVALRAAASAETARFSSGVMSP